LQEAAKTDAAKSETTKTETAKTETAKLGAAPIKPVAEAEKPKADVKAEPVAAKPAAKPEVVPVKTDLASLGTNARHALRELKASASARTKARQYTLTGIKSFYFLNPMSQLDS